ncbi:uncharacterized protein LOC131948454 [Physella acuta]|uniref:uncharacterized protein LOC131948454 n=1 Tax=Physella acuta TaxID=109671 RepID=UPI0027DD8E68|nr:uncharacterized protein LOC131948454 [Physella acuta]
MRLINSLTLGFFFLSSADSKALTIGLAVGIPLFCLLVAVVVVLLCLWKRRQNKLVVTRSLQSDDDEDGHFRSVFAQGFAKRGIFDGKDRPGFYDGFSDVASRASASTETGAKAEKAKGSFSWDFIYKILDTNKEDFQLPRPKLSPGYTSKI